MKVSCVIPCFNERQRVGAVLQEVLKISELLEIICVDDGSTDGTGDFIRSQFPFVRLISYPQNKGKSFAVKSGVIAAKGDYILIVDADLKNLKAENFQSVFDSMQNKSVDMVIFRRLNAPWFLRIRRSDVLLSGERLVRKSDLLKVLNDHRVVGFQIEMALNWYMYAHKKQCFWAPSQALNCFKIEKYGFWKGLINDIRMYQSIASQKDHTHRFRHLFFYFCKKQLSSHGAQERKH